MARRQKFDEDGEPIAPAYFFREPLVAFEGGPMDGQWLFRSDYEKARQAHERMRDAGQASYGAADYVLTSRMTPHRNYAGVEAITAVIG